MLPKLPGYAPTQDIDSDAFRRRSAAHLERSQEVKLAPVYATLLDEMSRSNTSTKKNGWETTTGSAFGSPPFEDFDIDVSEQRQRLLGAFREAILCFNACFFEKTISVGPEEARVRRVIVQFYLADDTLSINEPRQPNSGIPQGTLLKRQSVAKADGSPIRATDLRIGEVVEILSTPYFFCACDTFTREFFSKLGAAQSADIEIPPDEFERRTQNALMEKKNFGLNSYVNNGRVTSQKKFYEEGLKVLRFFARSDGEKYILYYYPADDTIEVRELRCWHGQKQGYVLLLRRQKMPKHTDVGLPGIPAITSHVLLCEFRPGATLSFLSRNFELLGCDLMTQTYMRDREGVEFPLQERDPAPDEVDPATEAQKGEYPPALHPDFFAVMDEVRELRFGACLVTPLAEDADRRFVIIFYLGTGALCIHERQVRNTGFAGGKFLEKGVYMLADGRPVEPADLLVGKLVTINSHEFKVLNCDERTRAWLRTSFGLETRNIE